jgi:hypothetical protein
MLTHLLLDALGMLPHHHLLLLLHHRLRKKLPLMTLQMSVRP